MLTYAVIALANLAGAAFAGSVGVGGAMVSLPLMLFVVSPTTAVLMTCSVGLWNVLLQSYAYRSDWRFSEVKWLILGTIPGAMIGVCVLKYAPTKILQIFLCTFILVFILIRFIIKGKIFKTVESRSFDIFSGMFCGMASSSVGMEGALLSIYVMLKNWSPNKARGNMSLFLIFAVVCGITSQLAAGLYELSMIPLIITGVISSSFGMIMGVHIGKKINKVAFDRILTCFLILVASILIYRVLS